MFDLSTFFFFFFFYLSDTPRDLHSFPTRRSSDLRSGGTDSWPNQQYLATFARQWQVRMISVSKCPGKRLSTERRRSRQVQPPYPARRPHGNGLLTDGPRSSR